MCRDDYDDDVNICMADIIFPFDLHTNEDSVFFFGSSITQFTHQPWAYLHTCLM